GEGAEHAGREGVGAAEGEPEQVERARRAVGVGDPFDPVRLDLGYPLRTSHDLLPRGDGVRGVDGQVSARPQKYDNWYRNEEMSQSCGQRQHPEGEPWVTAH